MSDEPALPSVPDVRTRLSAAAKTLRESPSLDPAVRGELAQLLDEFDRVLKAQAAPPAEVVHLAEGAAHLAEALQQRHDPGLVEASRNRLERLVFNAEARAPIAVNLAQALIDALVGLGI